MAQQPWATPPIYGGRQIDPATGLPVVMGMPAPAAKQPGIMDRLGGLLGGTPSYGGMVDEEARKAAQRQGLMAMAAQLMAAGGPSQQRVSFGQALGPALMAGQQAQGQGIEQAMQAMLLKTKLQQAKNKDTRPNSVREYEYAKANGYQGSFDEWQRIGTVQAKDPASIQEYNLAKSQGYQGTFEQWVSDRAKASIGAPFVLGNIGGVPTLINRTGMGGNQQLSTLPAEVAGASQLQEAQTRGSTLGKAQAERDATFQEDLNVIDDEILRTQRLLSEFKSGKYQTGPLAGRLPNMRTAAQDLEREQGKDTIKAISSATFGALSEGERGFLRELGVSQTANEESNVNMLERRLEELQRTKRRLTSRERLGVGPTAEPQPSAPSSRPPLSSFQK